MLASIPDNQRVEQIEALATQRLRGDSEMEQEDGKRGKVWNRSSMFGAQVAFAAIKEENAAETRAASGGSNGIRRLNAHHVGHCQFDKRNGYVVGFDNRPRYPFLRLVIRGV